MRAKLIITLLAVGVATLLQAETDFLDPAQRANWLPAPKGDFSFYVRAYWPKPAVTDESWTPRAIEKVK